MSSMATPAAWSPAPKSLTLSENTLHLWRARRPSNAMALRRCESILSEEEKKRAEKFLVRDAKECFVAARGILRERLGEYMNAEPAEIVLGCGPYGKPCVSVSDCSRAIRFNVSHSQGYGAFVFARGRETGIDIEQIRPEAAGEDIARRFFSPRGVEPLHAMPEGIRTE